MGMLLRKSISRPGILWLHHQGTRRRRRGGGGGEGKEEEEEEEEEEEVEGEGLGGVRFNKSVC